MKHQERAQRLIDKASQLQAEEQKAEALKRRNEREAHERRAVEKEWKKVTGMYQNHTVELKLVRPINMLNSGCGNVTSKTIGF